MERSGKIIADFFKGKNGQVSIELVLVTGAILVIAITVVPFIIHENMINKGVSSARDGATFAQTMFNMGYAVGGVSLPTGEQVKMDSIAYSLDTTTTPDTTIVAITLTLSGTATTAVATEIVSQAGNSIYYAYYGSWNSTTNGAVSTGKYLFNVTCSGPPCP